MKMMRCHATTYAMLGLNGRGNPADRERVLDACKRGGVSMFGSGISPGFVELISIATATICDRVDKITINEAADSTAYGCSAIAPCGT
jgi:hypothetical protein